MTDEKTAVDGEWVFTPYITKNGKRIYPKSARLFRFFVPRNKEKKFK
jgi:hypothetical protein